MEGALGEGLPCACCLSSTEEASHPKLAPSMICAARVALSIECPLAQYMEGTGCHTVATDMCHSSSNVEEQGAGLGKALG